MAHVSALCAWILAAWSVAPVQDVARAVCEDVGAAALVEGVPVELALAMAYTESRLNPDAESSAGALGPLQVIPRWHCPRRRARGCDLVGVGVRTLKRYRAKYGPAWADALCHWNSGNTCVRRARIFARVVLRRAHELSNTGTQDRCGQ